MAGARTLISNPTSWVFLVVFSVSQSVPGTWGAMMVTNLTKLGVGGHYISEEAVDTLGLVSCLARLVN